MAVLLPVFMLLVLAMLEAARMCMVAQLLTNAAREGCRVAASNGKTNSDVTTRVNATLTAAGITPSLVTTTLSPSDVTTATSSQTITVTLSVSFSKVNWLPSPFFYKSTTMTSQAVMLSQRP
jgi:Flp pilus assembly protein TadG